MATTTSYNATTPKMMNIREDTAETASMQVSDNDVEQGQTASRHTSHNSSQSPDHASKTPRLPQETSNNPQKTTTPQSAVSTIRRNAHYYGMSKRRVMFACLIMLVGMIAGGAFFSMGIVGLQREQEVLFERRAADITGSIEATWNQYETLGLWVCESCFSPLNETNQETVGGRLGLCSREKFRMLIESVRTVGVEVQLVGMIPQVTRGERQIVEDDTQAYYATAFPEVPYNGFTGFVPDEETGELVVSSMTEEDVYWPVHYLGK